VQSFNGPIPSRSDERVRRNKDGIDIEKVTAFGYVEKPEIGFPNVHPLVKSAFESLKTSAQVRYYEDSDWQYARLTMYFLNEMLWQNRLSAQMLVAVNQMLSNLMMTEGDRRRLRIEIERKENNPGATAAVTDITDVYRKRLMETGTSPPGDG
jgi:hypothetical protein